MRVRWTPTAADDLTQIHDYLLAHEPQLARPTVVELRDAIRSLQALPNRGRKGREDGTRELVHHRLPHERGCSGNPAHMAFVARSPVIWRLLGIEFPDHLSAQRVIEAPCGKHDDA